MDLEEFVADAVAQFGHIGRGLQFHALEKNLARQGVAVRMQATGGEADDGIAGANAFAIQHPRFLDHTNDRAAQVVFTRGVETWHLGGFAADEGATVVRAGGGEAFDDLGENAWFKFAGADVIEEKERFSAKHGDIVDAMIDQVLPDGVVAVHGEGQLELSADTVNAGDEYRLFVLARVESEQAAEPADLAQHLGPVGGGEQPGQGGFHPVAQINVHSRFSVGLFLHGSQFTIYKEIG